MMPHGCTHKCWQTHRSPGGWNSSEFGSFIFLCVVWIIFVSIYCFNNHSKQGYLKTGLRIVIINVFHRTGTKKWVLITQSCLTLCDATDCTLPGFLSIEFSRQEYWSELPFPSPGDLPNPRIEPSLLPAAGRFITIWATMFTLSNLLTSGFSM